MADQHPSVLPAGEPTPPQQQKTHTPWYAATATTAGRPLVLAATLVMSMPGEYHVAKFAGWSDPWAYGMPFSLSAYAGIAAVVAATRPEGARGRVSATVGAVFAIVLALAAQVVAHLSATGHMDHNQAWLIAVTSMVPPAVLAHLLHLAATPAGAPPVAGAARRQEQGETPVVERADAPRPPVAPPTPPAARPVVAAGFRAPELEPAPLPGDDPDELEPDDDEDDDEPDAPATPVYDDPRCEVVRRLYDTGHRPGTGTINRALEAAGYPRLSPSMIRGVIRAKVERAEPHLGTLPAETSPLRRGA